MTYFKSIMMLITFSMCADQALSSRILRPTVIDRAVMRSSLFEELPKRRLECVSNLSGEPQVLDLNFKELLRLHRSYIDPVSGQMLSIVLQSRDPFSERFLEDHLTALKKSSVKKLFGVHAPELIIVAEQTPTALIYLLKDQVFRNMRLSFICDLNQPFAKELKFPLRNEKREQALYFADDNAKLRAEFNLEFRTFETALSESWPKFLFNAGIDSKQ